MKRRPRRFADLCEMRQTYFDAEGISRSFMVSLSEKRTGNILGFNHYSHKVVNVDNVQDVLCGVSCAADSDVCLAGSGFTLGTFVLGWVSAE